MKKKLITILKTISTLAFITITFSIFINSSHAAGNSLFVSKSGSDSNSGTKSKPFKTIQKGVDSLNPGDTLFIIEGTYYENIYIPKSGQNGKLITIKNYNNQKVILNGNGKNSSGFYLENISYIRIEGIEITNYIGDDTPTGITVEGSGSGVQIVNNKISNIETSNNAHGIVVYGTNGSKSISNILIEGNEIKNCTLGESESLVVNGNVDKFKIINNTVHDNDNIGIDCIGFEDTASNNDQARNGIVKGNKVYNITTRNNPSYGGDIGADGIYVDGGKNIIIENNIVYNCDIGIEVASEHNNKITNNITVKNNVVYTCDSGITIGGAESSNGYADQCIFLNNTLYNNNVGIMLQKTKSNTFSNNIIYGKDLIEGNIGSNIFSFNLWYSKSGNSNIPGKNSKFADPKFNNPSVNDFRLKNNSPAIAMGNPNYKPSSGEKDIKGKQRVFNKIIDCGAYEYDSIKTETDKTKYISDSPTRLISGTDENTLSTPNTTTTKNNTTTKQKDETSNDNFISKNIKLLSIILIFSLALIIILRKIYMKG